MFCSSSKYSVLSWSWDDEIRTWYLSLSFSKLSSIGLTWSYWSVILTVNVIFSILRGFLFYNFQISILLKGHADLMDEINRFLFFQKLNVFQQRMLVCELWIYFLALLNFNSKCWFLAIYDEFCSYRNTIIKTIDII